MRILTRGVFTGADARTIRDTNSPSPHGLARHFGSPLSSVLRRRGHDACRFGGMDTGFNYYHGARPPRVYDASSSRTRRWASRRLRRSSAHSRAERCLVADPSSRPAQPDAKEMTCSSKRGYEKHSSAGDMARGAPPLFGEPSRYRRRLIDSSHLGGGPLTSRATSATPRTSAPSPSTPSRAAISSARSNLNVPPLNTCHVRSPPPPPPVRARLYRAAIVPTARGHRAVCSRPVQASWWY